jgi:hypothetical protein
VQLLKKPTLFLDAIDCNLLAVKKTVSGTIWKEEGSVFVVVCDGVLALELDMTKYIQRWNGRYSA